MTKAPSIPAPTPALPTRAALPTISPQPLGAAAPPVEPAPDAAATPERGLDVEVYADPDVGVAPLTVHFSAMMDDVPEATTFLWAFGDGDTTTGQSTAEHRYGAPGEYRASLTVATTAGQQVTREVVIQIDPPADTGEE